MEGWKSAFGGRGAAVSFYERRSKLLRCSLVARSTDPISPFASTPLERSSMARLSCIGETLQASGCAKNSWTLKCGELGMRLLALALPAQARSYQSKAASSISVEVS